MSPASDIECAKLGKVRENKSIDKVFTDAETSFGPTGGDTKPRIAVSSMPWDKLDRVILPFVSLNLMVSRVVQSWNIVQTYPVEKIEAAKQSQASSIEEVVRIEWIDLQAFDTPANLLRISYISVDPGCGRYVLVGRSISQSQRRFIQA
jgi:hypothetical protein